MHCNDLAYTQFVRQAVFTRAVYTLQDHEDFFAECPSEEHEDELGAPVKVYCFWHSPEQARACQSEEWEDFRVTHIALEEFMLDVLIEMDYDAQLVGVAFDEQLYGIEIEPIELLADLLDEIQKQHALADFPNFDELQRYRLEWEDILRKNTIFH